MTRVTNIFSRVIFGLKLEKLVVDLEIYIDVYDYTDSGCGKVLRDHFV